MKSVEAYNISGTDPEDDFRIMGYVTVESAVAMGEEHNANLDAATHLNLIGNIYFTSVSDIVFDDITLKSGEKMDGEEAFALAVEKMREANPDGKLIVTFLGNKDLTGDGLEIEDRHNEAMGEHKDKLIAGIVAVVKFDYEYPHKLKSYTVYEEFLAGMRAAVDALPGDILLTAAICDWQLTPAMFTVKDLEVFDFVEVMAYDCFDKRGDHSTFYTACYEQLRKFESKGFDLSRLNLGLPYYSRPIDGAAYWGNYYDVAEELYPFENSYVEAYTDLYGNSFPPLRNYYNGPQLIRDKTAYAIDCGAGGVMLWHLGTDSTDPTYSLTQLMDLYESGEMYLETILRLKKSGEPVHSIDVARYAGKAKSSVSRAIGILRDKGFIDIDINGHIEFTEKGARRAEQIIERHEVLTAWLRSIGVPAEAAEEDACRMEHVIGDATFEAIKRSVRPEN